MPQPRYLKQEITAWIAKLNQKNGHNPISSSYRRTYNLIRTKRFLAQTALIFVFQFLTLINLNFSYPALPMYPPIGVAFVFFYLLGNNAVWGLLLAECAAYLLKGLAFDTALIYLAADIFPSYIGAALSWRIFSSDIRPFARYNEFFKFLTINATTTCLLASILKFIPLIKYYKNQMDSISWDHQFLLILFLHFIDLWIADINAILILSTFIFSWAYLSFSREQISQVPLPKFFLLAVIIFIVLAVFFMPYVESILLLIFGMLVTLILSFLYGYLIATVLLFIVSSLYFAFFMTHTVAFLHYFGLGFYTLVPTTLLLYSLSVIYLGHKKVTF